MAINSDLPVVVGVDGSTASLAAVEFAVDEATLRTSPVLILYGHLRHPRLTVWRSRREPYVMRGIQRLLESVADTARARAPSIDITVDVLLERPGEALVEWSDRARLVVVGRSGRGGAALGSVAAYVASHARCPVIVHRPYIGSRSGSAPITVGVDASEQSAAAVRFALEEAAYLEADVDAVLVWSRPHGAEPAGLHAVGYDYAEAQAEAERMLSEQLAGSSAVYPDVRVSHDVIHGLDPAKTLLDRSEQARLIVVGSRGHGGVARLMLGSVSQSLINHAACPVAVVRQDALLIDKG